MVFLFLIPPLRLIEAYLAVGIETSHELSSQREKRGFSLPHVRSLHATKETRFKAPNLYILYLSYNDSKAYVFRDISISNCLKCLLSSAERMLLRCFPDPPPTVMVVVRVANLSNL